jgi:hypothetical protein
VLIIKHQNSISQMARGPFSLQTTQNQEGDNDEYIDVNYMDKAQSIIESRT